MQPKVGMNKTTAIISIGTGIAIQSILSIVLEITVARYFKPLDFATYQQTIMVLSFAPLLTFGFIESVIYFASFYNDDRKIISYTFYHLLFTGAISSLLIYLLRTNIASWFKNPDLEVTLRFYCFIPLFSFIMTMIPNYFIGKNKFVISRNLSITATGIIAVTIISVIFLYSNLNPSSVLLVRLLVTALVATILFFFLVIQAGWFFASFRLSDYRQLFNYAFSLGITRFIPVINVNMDKLMVSTMLGPVSFAYYKIGATEIPLSAILILSLGSALLPFYVNSIKNNNLFETHRTWCKGTLRAAMVSFPIGFLFFFFAPFIITTVFGKTYEPSSNIFRIYSLLLLIRINDSDVLAKAFNMNTIILYASLFALIFNVILNLILIHILGAQGAALSTLFTVILAWMYRLTKYSKLLECKFSEIVPWRKLGVLIFASSCCCGIAKSIPLLLGKETVITVAIGTMSGLVIYFLFIWNFGELDRQERKILKKFLNPLKS